MLHQNRLIVLLSLGFLPITFTEAMFIVFWYTNTPVLLLRPPPISVQRVVLLENPNCVRQTHG